MSCEVLLLIAVLQGRAFSFRFRLCLLASLFSKTVHFIHPYNLDSDNLEHSYLSAPRHHYYHSPRIHSLFPYLRLMPSDIVTTRSTETSGLTATHRRKPHNPYKFRSLIKYLP